MIKVAFRFAGSNQLIRIRLDKHYQIWQYTILFGFKYNKTAHLVKIIKKITKLYNIAFQCYNIIQLVYFI